MPSVPRGNVENLNALYGRCTDTERAEGYRYYDVQRDRLDRMARAARLPLESVVAAFAVLSPNNAESTNYRALDTCIEIAAGRLPDTARVIAYTPNKVKALRLLRDGEAADAVLGGLKVRAFYFNTMDPDDERYITVDGHMLSAWAGQRFILRRNAQIKGPREYEQICMDFRRLAECQRVSAPRLQASLWLAWKRINNILRPPQRSLELGAPIEGYRITGPRRDCPSGYRREAGRSIRYGTDTSSTTADQRHLEFDDANAPIAL